MYWLDRAEEQQVRLRWAGGEERFINSSEAWANRGVDAKEESFRNSLTRLICSWWEDFHDRVPTNKHNSGMPDLLQCGSAEWTPPFPGFHGGDPVSGGPSRCVHSHQGQKSYLILRQTGILKCDKVHQDSWILISWPCQPKREPQKELSQDIRY